MISVPFQNNTHFDVGPLDKTQNILNIQPVYPKQAQSSWAREALCVRGIGEPRVSGIEQALLFALGNPAVR
jgi:hypothetical protein